MLPILSHQLYRLLTITLMALIFYLSSQSYIDIVPSFSSSDKVMHVLAYGLLGGLFALSLKPWEGTLSWKLVGLITLFTIAYGISDEFHQSFVPGRDASVLDVVADGLGGLIAGFTLKKMGHKIFKKPHQKFQEGI